MMAGLAVPARPRLLSTRRQRISDVLFLGALFSVSFTALRWQIGGISPKLADFLILGFLVARGAETIAARNRRSNQVGVVLAFAVALALAYIVGAFALETPRGFVQFAKAYAYFVMHFAFLAAGLSYLASRSARFFHLSLAFVLLGLTANASYAALQLLAAKAGHDLDALVVSRITNSASRSLSYGLLQGPEVLRVRGLTLDPNHLGIMLLIPVLTLAALSVRQPPRARSLVLVGVVLVQIATLSRSALIGLAAGTAFLAVHYRQQFLSRAILVPTACVVAALTLVVARDADFYTRVFSSRMTIHSAAGFPHLHTYESVGHSLASHPLFGVGLNNFHLTYATRVGSHVEDALSFYVQSLVETGLVGTALLAIFLAYVFRRLHGMRRVERPGEEEDSNRREAISSGLTAALVGTLAANVSYSTMSFSYFYAFLLIALGASLQSTDDPERLAPEAHQTHHFEAGAAQEAPPAHGPRAKILPRIFA
jgi:hypothetical protein